MKPTFCLPTAALLLASALAAAPVMETTAVQSQPQAGAPVIGYLKAGTEPVPAAAVTAPSGWMAVEIQGPHEGYVRNNDLSKGLDVHVGAAIRLRPRVDAPVLATMQEGDKTEITGLRSGWTQIRLMNPVTGYIRIGGISAAPAAAAAYSSAASVPPPPPPAVFQAPPPAATPGHPAALAQVFEGTLAKASRVLLVGPRHDFGYQLNDGEGRRVAFLDLSHILPIEKIDLIIGQRVTITGILHQTYNGKHLVIEALSLQAK